MTTRVRYVFETTVKSVREKVMTAGGPRDRTDNDQETAGWFVRLDQSSALYFGLEKPDLAAGDKVCVTIEKIP